MGLVVLPDKRSSVEEVGHLQLVCHPLPHCRLAFQQLHQGLRHLDGCSTQLQSITWSMNPRACISWWPGVADKCLSSSLP